MLSTEDFTNLKALRVADHLRLTERELSVSINDLVTERAGCFVCPEVENKNIVSPQYVDFLSM